MAETGVCRLCGKTGTWERYLSRGHEGMMLKHYCPVKAKARADKKKAEHEKKIDQVIKEGENACWHGFHFSSDAQVIIFRRYPVKNDHDDFFRINWTTEDFNQLHANENAVKRFQHKVFEFIKTKRRFPTRRMYDKWAEEV